MKNWIFAGFLVFVFLVGTGLSCVVINWVDDLKFRHRLESVTEEVEIVKVDPPYYVYLTLKSVETGEVFPRVYVSMRYKDWQKIKVGSRFTITRTRYARRPNEHPDRWIFDRKQLLAICDSLTTKEKKEHE